MKKAHCLIVSFIAGSLMFAQTQSESPEHLFARLRYEEAKRKGLELLRPSMKAGAISECLHGIADKKNQSKCDLTDDDLQASIQPYCKIDIRQLKERGNGVSARQALKLYDCADKIRRTTGPVPDLSVVPIDRLEKQLLNVDLCVTVYRQTIDKRISDLTTRESDLVNSCKALDLYPPERGGH